ncbi:nucleotidyltransferase family protein [Mesorhizobium sp. L-8-3]|uniref:nucleotidyltransferase family protein n=1 Tax=Mesorhizobium sp. L-8-3 TaxID=2744522 RepID=UPI00313DD037
MRCLGLPQCFLTAGCLFQTVWNLRSSRPAQADIKDYDIFYFDNSDLSWDAEDEVIQQAKALLSDLQVSIEVKNQARVHLWYEKRFGGSYPQLRSSKDGIDHFLISGTCVGIDVSTGELYAPNGVQAAWNGVLEINPKNARPDLFRKKAEDFLRRRPWLTIDSLSSPGRPRAVS